MESPKNQGTTFIGQCNFRGNDRAFGIKVRDRRQHMYVIGQTGTGKTTLLKNLVLQDIQAGRGLAIVDPHGEFVEEVLEQIPPSRTEDVIYFNPVDADFPIGFNVLETPDTRYKHLIVSDLLGIFTKIWANVWSARMEYILQNCILALIDTPGTTLLGIPRILVDKDYRQRIVGNVKDPVVRSFWLHEYETWRDQFRNEAIVPIQNKVGQFLNTGFIRNMVGQQKSTINIAQIMNDEKILLANVSKGRIGEDNSQLLGAMLITKIQLAAMERVRILEEERRDFYLYVDEFQNFATDSFSNILSEARKYRLNLIIAHQYIGQLVTDVSTKVRDAVFGNVGTMIAFRVGAPDAEFLETQFTPEFMQSDLIGLPNHHIYLRLMVDGVTSRPFSAATMRPLKYETAPDTKLNIIQSSRAKYAMPLAEVEQEIARWSGMTDGSGGGEESKSFDATCWNCGKATTVPFKPDGKRPVYCSNCYKQVEEGKLIPLPDRMPQNRPAQFSASLEDLGIEFASAERPASSLVPSSRGDAKRPLPSRAPDGNRPRPVAPSPVTSQRHIQMPDQQNQNQQRERTIRTPPSRRNEPMRQPAGNHGESQSHPSDRQNQQQRFSHPQTAARTPHQDKPLGLSELQSRSHVKKESKLMQEPSAHPPRPQVDLGGLKKALASALQERGTPNPTPSHHPPVPPKERPKSRSSQGEEPKKQDNVMKPGDAISL